MKKYIAPTWVSSGLQGIFFSFLRCRPVKTIYRKINFLCLILSTLASNENFFTFKSDNNLNNMLLIFKNANKNTSLSTFACIMHSGCHFAPIQSARDPCVVVHTRRDVDPAMMEGCNILGDGTSKYVKYGATL